MTVKRIHEYVDFDGNKVNEQLEFNLTRVELARNLHLTKEFEDMKAIIDEEETREMTPAEIKKMFDLIAELMRLTYGVRSEKAGRVVFVKNQEIWESFVESAIYDSFIFWLFEEKERANDFMEGLMPASLREEAAKIQLDQQDKGAPIVPYEVPVAPEPENKGGQKPKRQSPTQEELLAAWQEKERNRQLDPSTDS